MAKSPLMAMLQRACQIAQKSHQTRIPIDELVGMKSAHLSANFPISRRRLLRGGLMVGSALITSSWPRQPVSAQSGNSPILIVGGGLSGLTAAYRLSQAGVRTDIIEATNRIGGRVRSLNKTCGTGTLTELGGEFINSDQVTIITLATELGLNLVDLNLYEEGLISESYFFRGQRISLEKLATDFSPLAKQISEDYAKIGSPTYQSSSQEAIQLDNISLAEYIDRGETSSYVRQAIRVAYTLEYGRDIDEQSCLNLINLMGTEEGQFNILGDSDEQYQVAGGNQQILNKLASRLLGSLETGISLESIHQLSDGRYRVSLRSGATFFDRVYERILLTIPFSVLRNIPLNVNNLSPDKQNAIQELGYGTNSKLLTAYRSRIWKDVYRSTADTYTDLGYQSSWEASPFTPGNIGVVTAFSGGTVGLSIGSGNREDQARRFLQQFDRVFQGVTNERIGQAVRAYWSGEMYQRGSYSCYLVGQWTKIRGLEGERVGNLYFAGEHTSPNYQGYMEGACESGEIAAISILSDLGLQAAAQALQNKRNSQRQ